jgi:hypothetical protein
VPEGRGGPLFGRWTRGHPRKEQRGAGVEEKRARHRAPAPDDQRRDDRAERGDARKQKVLLRPRLVERPEAQQWRGVEERRPARAEHLHLAARAGHPERVLHGVVLVENREERQREHDPRREDGDGAPPFRPPIREHRDPGRDEHGEEEHVVAVRQRLQQPCDAEQREHRRPSS